MLFYSSLYSFGDLPNDSFHQVKTTGEAGGLIRPCKGLSPASANRALKIWQSRLYYRQPPSSGGPRLSTKRVLSESESTLFVDSLFHQHSWWFSFSAFFAQTECRVHGSKSLSSAAACSEFCFPAQTTRHSFRASYESSVSFYTAAEFLSIPD